MSGNCKDCKWAEEQFRVVNGASLGLACLLISDDEDVFYGIKPDHNAGRLATIASYEPSQLRVEPDFGCVQFEAKDV